MIQHTLGEFEELVLLTVAAQHNEAYGVSILDDLERELDKKLNISAIHVALKRMEDKGFVKSRFGGITEDRGGRRKKFYVITALGKRMLDEQHEVRNAIYKRIPKISFG
ncbi:MAG TPA: helix-turn-helix transcriptional regulator [Cyclobacteriaceae bacterium]|nr:helix-turn-helix transcriptional regulator [Cyclobacteriaceae bacterium]